MLKLMPHVTFCCLLLGCGGGREVLPEFTWDSQPATLVASVGVKGGFVMSMTRFLQHDYGGSFMRLMGDGTLYFGEPNKVKKRTLTPAEIRALLRLVRPDLFADYKDRYDAAKATDMPYTWVTLNTPDHGKYKIGIYGFGFSSTDYGDTPSSLVAAVKALNAVRAGGKALTPTKIRIATQEADLKNHSTLDKAKIQAWPVKSLDPANASLLTTGDQGYAVTSKEVTAALLPLFKMAPMGLMDDAVMVKHGAKHYQLNHAVVLP